MKAVKKKVCNVFKSIYSMHLKKNLIEHLVSYVYFRFQLGLLCFKRFNLAMMSVGRRSTRQLTMKTTVCLMDIFTQSTYLVRQL
jgi:hypothetical protein